MHAEYVTPSWPGCDPLNRGIVRYFCTYFDRHYMIRGLALYESLKKFCTDFRFYVLALDSECFDALVKMNLPELQPFSLEQIEKYDPDLLIAKANRRPVEYYYTLSPIINLFILENFPEVDLVTYLDSDLYFFNSPDPLFQELSNDSIAITGHRFPPNLLHLRKFGIYNVAWLSIRRDSIGLSCLRWWREKCLEWCYERLEDNRFADQKYLDDWPERFPGTIVLQHKGANVAPWNLSNYIVALNGSSVRIDDQELIFFHFHRFRQVAPSLYDFNLAPYKTKSYAAIRQGIFKPYAEAILKTKNKLQEFLPEAGFTLGVRKKGQGIVDRLKNLYRFYQKILNGDFVFMRGPSGT
jgi:hypothetical protein